MQDMRLTLAKFKWHNELKGDAVKNELYLVGVLARALLCGCDEESKWL